jgi:hypothetical protein
MGPGLSGRVEEQPSRKCDGVLAKDRLSPSRFLREAGVRLGATLTTEPVCM